MPVLSLLNAQVGEHLHLSDGTAGRQLFVMGVALNSAYSPSYYYLTQLAMSLLPLH